MNAKLIILSYITLFSLSARAFDENATVKLGPLNVSMDFCSQIDKVSAITSSMSNVTFPVTGVPGISTGLVSKDSVLLEFCGYLQRLKGLDLQDAANLTLDAINKVNGNKWDDQLTMARSTFDLKDIVLDSSGKKRPMAEMITASNASKLNSFMKESADYHDKHVDPNNPINLRTREQIEGDMNRLSSIAYKKALINDVSNCPTTNPSDEKLAGIYEKEIVPQKEQMEIHKEYIDFYSESLRQMGVKFSGNEKDHAEFLKKLSALEISGLRYEITVRTAKVETVKRRKIMPPPKDPAKPTTEEYKEKIDKKYQTFAVVPDDNLVDAFAKAYSSKWEGYTASQVVQRVKGLADSPVRRVEDDFKDWSIICNLGEIKSHHDREDEKFDQKVALELEECKEKKNEEISKTGNLLKFYSYELQKRNKMYKEGQAHIWTFESYHLGNFRSVDGKTDSNGFAQEKVACTPISNLGALQDLALKQDGINLEINQMLVEQAMKQNQMIEAKANEDRLLAQEAERRRSIEEESRRRQSQDYFQHVKYPEMNKGL